MSRRMLALLSLLLLLAALSGQAQARSDPPVALVAVRIPDSGAYTGTLVVSNCGGQDERAFSVTVTCPPPGWRVYLPLVVR